MLQEISRLAFTSMTDRSITPTEPRFWGRTPAEALAAMKSRHEGLSDAEAHTGR
ncbi:hypothetical protein [Alsobacter sp. R-9]